MRPNCRSSPKSVILILASWMVLIQVVAPARP